MFMTLRIWKKRLSRVISLIFVGGFLVVSTQAHAQLDRAWELLRTDNRTTQNYPGIIEILVKQKLYFTAVPYIKEYLTRNEGRTDQNLDLLIDKVVSVVGVRQFEVMPERFLERSAAPTLQYVLAKKYFRAQQYDRARQALNRTIPSTHPVKPFALLLEGSIASIQGRYGNAIQAYRECIARSTREISRSNEYHRQRQLHINRDNCIVGIPRAHFGAGNYSQATQAYLDLNKSSYIWPEILFEEAWSSFYERDYNRTLGKLVTYKAPILDFIFNPEIEVLNALTYLEMCLWGDAQKVADDFYDDYERETEQIQRFLNEHGRDYKYFYLLSQSVLEGRQRGGQVLNRMLRTIVRDPAFVELYESFQAGRSELEQIQNIRNERFRQILGINLRDALLLQRDLIGAYVRANLDMYTQQAKKALVDMSYIKLEVLSRRRAELYDFSITEERSRGDISNVRRSSKQYFWTFNGEFWADELGDYVFSLQSECR